MLVRMKVRVMVIVVKICDKDRDNVEWLILCCPRGFGNIWLHLVLVKSLLRLKIEIN